MSHNLSVALFLCAFCRHCVIVAHRMRLIGVIDLLGTRAVHARAGARDRYTPVTAVAGVAIEPGDPVALARQYIDRFHISELYVANLDAILRTEGATNDASIARLTALAAPVWLEAGVSSGDAAHRALGLGAAQVIVGLETLPSYHALAAICDAVGGDQIAFSLDLRDTDPVVMNGGTIGAEPADVMAGRAVDAGVAALVVIDLARVGTGQPIDSRLISRVRQAAPDVTLLAGGGIRGVEDIQRLADSGCDGVLVATALHTGQLTASDIAAIAKLPGRARP